MLMTERDFLKVKPRFVQEVLEKLRVLARREAELLVRVHHHHPHVPMPLTSTRLSRVMIRTADAIQEAIDRYGDEGRMLLRQLVIDHLPLVLVEHAGEDLWTRLPETYLRWMMAKSLAARIVYREGFEYLDAMPMAAIADLALEYLRRELERQKLAESVLGSSLEQRERIAGILCSAGIFATLGNQPAG